MMAIFITYMEPQGPYYLSPHGMVLERSRSENYIKWCTHMSMNKIYHIVHLQELMADWPR